MRSLRLNTFVPFEIFDSFVVKIIATDSQINYTANSQINLKLIQKKKRIDEKMIDKKMIVDFSLRTLRKPLRSLRLNTFVPFEIFVSFVVKKTINYPEIFFQDSKCR